MGASMNPFTNGSLQAWCLEPRQNANINRQHRLPSDSECWEKQEVIGSGSFGEVWRERCVSGLSEGALRAVKRIRVQQSNFSEMSRRELDALTAFSDPNFPEYKQYFVQFLGWFNDADYLCLAMELMEYGDLQIYIKRLAMPFPESEGASITSQGARALQHMHSKKFVHRDIKPLNILVACPGPRWHVKVADFGIAKNTEGTALGTQRIGTISYMAPGLFSTQPYTAAVDIWALGALTYCMCTGFPPPFSSVQNLLEYARDPRVKFPSGSMHALNESCLRFVLSTMAKVPEQRLTIAQVLNHTWLSRQSNATPQGSESSGRSAASSPDPSVAPSNNWSTILDNPADQWVRMTDPGPASFQLPSTSIPLQAQMSSLPLASQIHGHKGHDSTDNERGQDETSEGVRAGSAIFRQKQYDLAEPFAKKVVRMRRKVLHDQHPDTITAMVALAAIYRGQGKEDEAQMIDVEVLNLRREVIGFRGTSYLASASADKKVKIWNTVTGRCVTTLEGHTDQVNSVAWSPDATRIASASSDSTVKIWDLATCLSTSSAPPGYFLTRKNDGHSGIVGSVSWSSDVTQLASAGDNTIKCWDPATSQCILTNKSRPFSLSDSLVWSPDARRLAFATWECNIRICDRFTSEFVSTPKGHHIFRTKGGHNGYILSISWSPDATRIASASVDKKIKIWDTGTGQNICTLEGHTSGVASVAWAPNTTHLASGSYDKTIKIWNMLTSQCISTFKGHDSRVCSVSWSPNTTQLASASKDKTVKIWNPATGQCISTLKGHSDSVLSVAWSPNVANSSGVAYFSK
ncbi:uncharacterized protein N7477_010078 [Penicillium maclennaniae]|uniref:uncharacterized protein n=1 Tax=Penicillium maclennaniae TaxID=1343394 RepID=UPI0025416C72|nr:uncharacterized protein N7477_010078 [Penicillium maclennaniae]KAJ5662462.1 hypothetical protein N7477_010078 [Penicillium maclennaniae]